MNNLDHYNHHQKIAVCATDHWFGNVIARSLLLDGKHNIVVRCLAQDTNKHVKKLDRLGGEIHRIDYDRPETIKDALHGVNFLIFIGEADKNRVKEAKVMADAAADRDVDNAIILSVEGAEDGDGKIMNDFREMEKEVCQRIKHSCVIRNSFLQQAFFLWSPNVEDRGEINMTPRESNEWAPINLDDLVCAIAKLMLQEGKVVTELNKKHRCKVYRLTGPELVTGRKVAETINRVIEGRDAVEVIENIQKSLDVVPFLLDGRHRHDRHPQPFLPLSKYEIELILEGLDYVKEGKADHTSDDYKKITGEKPTRIKSFFEDNAESFRPGKNTRPRRPRDSDDKSDTLIMGRRINKL
ncbi:hypothetical protein C2G38_147363 [Gigaspora rosea]|uniref:Uncharacterized protein n=1 Tax=Gigaspora rosea TaxID=44941 RepID=A0A397UP32_9GLOM|nr:hypothetical protein C2G38_147363 [Gigaspora rosea]